MSARPYFGRKKWFIEFIEEWSQLFGGQNWYTCTFLRLELENDKIMGGYEATFIILGVGLRWRWNHTQTELMDEIDRAMDEIKKREKP